MKLSIIIPVYNVEKYLKKCLTSCVMQDYPLSDYEIVIVDDGSFDNSYSIAAIFAKQYKNVQIMHQKNQGLSAARNQGMKMAHGDYFWFVDSDDYIEANCLKRIISQLKDNLDILQLQYRLIYEDGVKREVSTCMIEGIKNGYEITKNGGLPAPAQFSIFRSSFLVENDLKFFLGIYHEDTEFKPKATYLAKKIASDTTVCYNYLQRTSGGITSRFKIKNGLDLLIVMNSLLQFVYSKNLSTKFKRCFYCQIGINMNSLLLGFKQLKEEDKQTLYIALKQNRHLFNCMISSGKTKYQIEGLFLKFKLIIAIKLHGIIRNKYKF